MTCRHPPQLGLLSEDRALCDLLRVKSNPQNPLSPPEPLKCDKVRVQTLPGARGSQTELGSRVLHIFFCMTVCVCVYVCVAKDVFICLWSCNVIRSGLNRRDGPQFECGLTNPWFYVHFNTLSVFFLFFVIVCECNQCGARLLQGLTCFQTSLKCIYPQCGRS